MISFEHVIPKHAIARHRLSEIYTLAEHFLHFYEPFVAHHVDHPGVHDLPRRRHALGPLIVQPIASSARRSSSHHLPRSHLNECSRTCRDPGWYVLRKFFVHFSAIHPTSRKRIAVTHRTLTPLRYDSPRIFPIWRVSSSLIWCRSLGSSSFCPRGAPMYRPCHCFRWPLLELLFFALIACPSRFYAMVHNNFPTEETSTPLCD